MLMASPAVVLVVFRGTEVLVEGPPGALRLSAPEVAQDVADSSVFVGEMGNVTWRAARARDGLEPPHGAAFSPIRALFAELPETELHWVGRALACLEFEDQHRYCGRCGTLTASGVLPATSNTTERVRTCPQCSLTFHPRIPPAVIVLVERDGELLLARGAQFPSGLFSAVAGFVEIGESLEQTARREVREEVGVEITDLRYFSSQPWPFGHSLMVAFHARYAGGELRPDGTEIVEAAWFSRAALPLLPPPISIARRMIDAFLSQ